MKKTFLIIGFFLAFALVLTGCQKVTENNVLNDVSEQKEQTQAPEANTGDTEQTQASEVATEQEQIESTNPRTEGTEKPAAAQNNALGGQQTQMANPASKNCIDQGGTLEMRNAKNGQYGVCIFDDNRQCEEWALFRGQCPKGGLKITGYENEAEIYCAITGGTVEDAGTSVPMCKRTDGTLCNAEANMNGECPNPINPEPNAGNRETE